MQRGNSTVRAFTLSSCSEIPVSVAAIQRGVSIFGALPDTFQLDPMPAFPIILQPGQSQDIQVRYTPMQAGIEAGFWQIISDDAQEPEQRVDVSAIAEPPELRDVQLHVRMNWDTDLTDVDLHLVGPNGQLWSCDTDCYFANGGPDWGMPNRFEDDPFLDLDTYGPSTFGKR